MFPGTDGVHTLTITGSGFTSSDVADFSVMLAGMDCEVTAVSANSVRIRQMSYKCCIFDIADINESILTFHENLSIWRIMILE